MGLCLAKHKRDGDDSDHNIEFTGGNVHLITTEESWEQKMAEAKRDGRIRIEVYWSNDISGLFVNVALIVSKIGSGVRIALDLNCHGVVYPVRLKILANQVKFDLVVIANFSAAWCGPCRMISPFYIELSEKHPSLMFLVIDVDELTDFSTTWDIKATPTFFFLRDGQQFDKIVGANKPELQKKITALLNPEVSSQA